MLDDLTAAGLKLAVCTNKLEWLSLRLLEALNLTQRFAAICGPDTFGATKPDPEILWQTVRRAGGEPSRAIMIGNSKTDIHTARAARIPVIAVDFGYTDVPIEGLHRTRSSALFPSCPRPSANSCRPKRSPRDLATHACQNPAIIVNGAGICLA